MIEFLAAAHANNDIHWTPVGFIAVVFFFVLVILALWKKK